MGLPSWQCIWGPGEIVIKSEFLKHFGNGEQLKGVFLMEESSTVSVVKHFEFLLLRVVIDCTLSYRMNWPSWIIDMHVVFHVFATLYRTTFGVDAAFSYTYNQQHGICDKDGMVLQFAQDLTLAMSSKLPFETIFHRKSDIIMLHRLPRLLISKDALSSSSNKGSCRANYVKYKLIGARLTSNYAAVDLGGSVITGIHGKPLGVLARELSVSLHKVGDRCPLYEPEGRPIGIKEVYYGCANDKSDGYGLILSLHKSTMSEDVGWKSYKCTGGIMAEEAIVGSNVYV
ncbi:hypothetical protein Tco_0958434 [Tanacetum coccineum]